MKLCYPVNYIGITGEYTPSHQALDLGWYKTRDIPILACYNGVVSRIYEDVAYGGGLTLVIKYDNNFSSSFKHLSKTLVKVGDRVSQMQEVAIMGNSGWSTTGNHLHFILYDDDKIVNPLDYCYVYPNQEVAPSDKDRVKYYDERGDEMKFKIGDRVIINGNLYVSPNATNSSGKVTNKTTIITRIAEGTLHPYNTTGDLGWMSEDDIRLYEETTDYRILYEQQLEISRSLQEQLNIANQKITQAINILQ